PRRIKPPDRSGFPVAWLWQLGPHREDIQTHAYQLRFGADHYRPRKIPISRRTEVLFQGDAPARRQRDPRLQPEAQTPKAARRSQDRAYHRSAPERGASTAVPRPRGAVGVDGDRRTQDYLRRVDGPSRMEVGALEN